MALVLASVAAWVAVIVAVTAVVMLVLIVAKVYMTNLRSLIRNWASLFFVHLMSFPEICLSICKSSFWRRDGKLGQPAFVSRESHMAPGKYLRERMSCLEVSKARDQWLEYFERSPRRLWDFQTKCAFNIDKHNSQIRKIADCACAANAGNVFPATDFKSNR